MTMESNITRQIKNCTACAQSVNTPFCFPMHDQPIMLISAAPSMQAMYKPLYSIRFFRIFCLSLFGDKYLREAGQAERYIREFCDGNIYWTHYRKCYQPDLKNFDALDDYCANRYLNAEMATLKKNLKLVIVLGGDTIHQRVLAAAPPEVRELMCFKPFPSAKTIESFDDIRRLLGDHLKYIKKNKIGFVYKDGASRYIEELALAEGNEVHLRFEQEAFNKMMSDEALSLDGSIEAVWHKNLVVPNMRRCAKLVQTASFIENQIKVQMSDYFNSTGNYTILRPLRQAGNTPSFRNAMIAVNENWRMSFADYIFALAPTKRKQAESIVSRMTRLAYYRNAVVHNGGLLESRDTLLGERDGIPGIDSFVGTVLVTAEGEKTLTDFTNEISELLCTVRQ